MFQIMTYQIPQWLASEIENLASKYNFIHGSMLQLINYVIHLEKKLEDLVNEKTNSIKFNKNANLVTKDSARKDRIVLISIHN